MPLFGIDRPLDERHLLNIVGISPGRPVFLATATDNSTVVLKNEVQVHASDPHNMKMALKVAKTASPAGAGKTLTYLEVQAVQSYFETKKYISEVTMQPLPPDVKYLGDMLEANGMWYKMAKAEGIVSIEDAQQRAANGNKTDVRSIAAALSAHDGLESLGRIIAADLWNGNNDRFSPNGGVDGHRVLVNAGNVLLAFHGNQNTLKPIGLDAYEAMGMFRNYQQTIGDLEGVDQWGGRLLANTAASNLTLKTFCDDAIADIEDVLGPRNRKILFAKTRRLPSNASNRLQQGVLSGAIPIRTKMRMLAGRANPSPGLISRLQTLGWWP